MDEHTSPLYDPASCAARILVKTGRAVINVENIRNRFFHNDRHLYLGITVRSWTNIETAVHEQPMKLINAPIRAARWGGRAA